MNKFRTIVSVLVMVLAGAAGLFAGSLLGDGLRGAILFSMIAGVACVIYVLDNPEK